MAVPFIVKAAIVAISFIYTDITTRNAKKRAREDAINAREASNGLDIRPSPADGSLPEAYGLTFVPTHPVFIDSADSLLGSSRVRAAGVFFRSAGSTADRGERGISCRGTRVTTNGSQLIQGTRSLTVAVGGKYLTARGDLMTVTSINLRTYRTASFSTNDGGSCQLFNSSAWVITFDRSHGFTSANEPISLFYGDEATTFSVEFGTMRLGDDRGQNGKKQYLLCQYAALSGNYASIKDMSIDDSALNNAKYESNVFIDVRTPSLDEVNFEYVSRPLNIVADFSSRRDDTAEFYGMSYVSAFYYNNISSTQPLFNGYNPPTLDLFVEGQTIRRLSQSTFNVDGSVNSYGDFNWTNNAVDILFHILTNPFQEGGQFVDDADIDLNSFIEASIANEENKILIGNDLRRREPISGRVNSGNRTRDVFPYAFDGLIDSKLSLRDKLELILKAMPGAFFYRNRQGKYSISIPFISARKSALITSYNLIDDSIIQGEIKLSLANDVINTFILNYKNMETDFSNDSLKHVNNTLKGNRQEISRQERVEGVSNEFNARFIAKTRITDTIRRTYEMTLTHAFLLSNISIGDIVKFQSDNQEIPVRLVRVQEVTYLDDYSAKVILKDYVSTDYSNWWE